MHTVQKTCTKCKRLQPLDQYSGCNHTRDRKQSWCRSCNRELSKETRRRQGVKVRSDRPEVEEGKKWCRKCERVWDNSFFPKGTTKSDGLGSWCRECCKKLEDNRRRKLGIKAKPKPHYLDSEKKECLKCRRILSMDDYPKNPRGRLKRGSYCHDCWRKYLTQDRFREKHKLAMRKWRDQHREYWRSRHRLHQFKRRMQQEVSDDGTVTKEFVELLYSEIKCHYCEQEIAYKQRTIDHVIPLARGGIHSASNLVMACLSCNCAKQDRTKEEFLLDKCQNSSGFAESSWRQTDHVCCGIPQVDIGGIEHTQNAFSELCIEPSHPCL